MYFSLSFSFQYFCNTRKAKEKGCSSLSYTLNKYYSNFLEFQCNADVEVSNSIAKFKHSG